MYSQASVMPDNVVVVAQSLAQQLSQIVSKSLADSGE
jgi:hypothetical protein